MTSCADVEIGVPPFPWPSVLTEFSSGMSSPVLDDRTLYSSIDVLHEYDEGRAGNGHVDHDTPIVSTAVTPVNCRYGDSWTAELAI